MTAATWLGNLFGWIVSNDIEVFVGNRTEDAVFQFANMPPVKGRQEIGESVAQFFGSVRALKHTLIDHWEAGASLISRRTVVSAGHHGAEMSFRFTNIMTSKESMDHVYAV